MAVRGRPCSRSKQPINPGAVLITGQGRRKVTHPAVRAEATTAARRARKVAEEGTAAARADQAKKPAVDDDA